MPLVCLMSLRTDTAPVLLKLDRRRALFVLTKIDEILAWEQRKDSERDTKFVELGRYLCEVRDNYVTTTRLRFADLLSR